MTNPISTLRQQLEYLSVKDAHALRQRLSVWQSRLRQQLPCDKLAAEIERDFTAALDRMTAKLALRPTIDYPEALPIAQKREDIAKAIGEHQVVVVAGETGSGKTTQLPKICLELGRGLRGRIGHTQPRRIAARTVATRIAEELRVTLGSQVGYQVRFHDQTDDNTLVKLMTDGVLLAEIQHDPLLLAYDTLIVDEAHERSLNIDFLLGFLKKLLPQRPDLKLVITSATIDVERFSQHFNHAPIIEVSGRTYPVETLYLPSVDSDEDMSSAVLRTVAEVIHHYPPGDILVFLAGERDIREVSHAIKRAEFRHLEVLPLYSRLSVAEQNRIFNGHSGRRVVLATNVAETSITVPGIKYVIDPGYARISRYSFRTKVQRLPIEAISQASANQRKGRCGRTSDGVCFRLYAEEDFLQRPQFTDPEILRTNLAAVILQMLSMGLGDVREFPFVDAPDTRMVGDGFKLLEEIKAVDARGRITALGKKLSLLPIDPRLGAVILQAQSLQCLEEILIMVAALSIQDPRERPADKQQAADEKHRRFWDEHSDFIAYLNLWKHYEEQRQALSQNQLKKMCQQEFINFLRMREWRDLHHQLKLAVKAIGLKANGNPATYEAIHKALVCGYVTQIGIKDKETGSREYEGTRQKKFTIFPGSSQHKKRPQWIVAAEFIETSNLFAHCVAKIEPEWVLHYADHLTRKQYFEPHYDVKMGQVRAYVKTTLFGLTLEEKRRVAYAHIDAEQAGEVFVREALVEGKYRGKGDFFSHNQKLIEEVEALEAKSRRRDILVDDQVLFDFYRARVPRDISNLKGFEHWRKTAEQDNPALLKLDKATLMLHGAGDISEQQFPDSLPLGDYQVAVQYQFEPGKAHDGVNIIIPVDILHDIPEAQLEWTVPGVRRDKCIALVKALPKSLRKHFVPIPDVVDKVLPRLQPGNQKLCLALGEALGHISRVNIDPEQWNEAALDDFYRVNIQVVDEQGRVVDQSRDLQHLRLKYRKQVQRSLAHAGDAIERQGLQRWDFGVLDSAVVLPRGSVNIKAYPALVPERESVALKVLDNPLEALYLSRRGVVKLAAFACGDTVKYLRKQLLQGKDLGLSVVSMGSKAEVVEDMIHAAIRDCVLQGPELPRDAESFAKCLAEGKAALVPRAFDYEKILVACLSRAVAIKKRIKENRNPLAIAMAVQDMQQQLAQLLAPQVLSDTAWEDVQEFPRYLEAMLVRLDKVAQHVNRDLQATKAVQVFWQLHAARLAQEGPWAYAQNRAWQEFRWMIEELRVSFFAQTLKTRVPVSEKRLKKQWESSF